MNDDNMESSAVSPEEETAPAVTPIPAGLEPAGTVASGAFGVPSGAAAVLMSLTGGLKGDEVNPPSHPSVENPDEIP